MQNHIIAALFATVVAFAVAPVSVEKKTAAAPNQAAASHEKDRSSIELLHIYIIYWTKICASPPPSTTQLWTRPLRMYFRTANSISLKGPFEVKNNSGVISV